MKLKSSAKLFLAYASCLMVMAGCDKSADEPLEEVYILPIPAHFPAMPVPADNQMTAAKINLGRHLFFDKRFSLDRSVSCGSCHHSQQAFSDSGNATSAGFNGMRGTRNAPGLSNIGYSALLFWEGGVSSLEAQALAPIANPIEMNMTSDTLVARLGSEPQYQGLFISAWGDSRITMQRITMSLGTFERSLISGHSPYDRWIGGDNTALSPAAQRGLNLFFGERGDCFHCHGGFRLTDGGFHNTGLDSLTIDPGRYLITGNEADKGKFKTPSLRNVGYTGPYMHDGRFNTLEEVLNHYNSGGRHHPNRSNLMRPLGLTQQQISDIIAFLESLTDHEFLNNQALKDPWPTE